MCEYLYVFDLFFCVEEKLWWRERFDVVGRRHFGWQVIASRIRQQLTWKEPSQQNLMTRGTVCIKYSRVGLFWLCVTAVKFDASMTGGRLDRVTMETSEC